MAQPNIPGGTLRTTLAEMNVGDYIPCEYVSAVANTAGTFSQLGTSTATDLSTVASTTPNGRFYFIKVDTGLLIADRVVQTGVSWNVLNAVGYIQGTYFNLVPKLSSSTYTGVGNSFSSSIAGSTWDHWKAFNGSAELDGWQANGSTGFVGFQFTNAIVADSYMVYPYYDVPTVRSPKNWTFEGSLDGVNWTVLDTQTNHIGSSWKVNVGKSFSFNNTTAYNRYRLNISANNGDVFVGVGELVISSKNAKIRVPCGGVAFKDFVFPKQRTSTSIQSVLGAWNPDSTNTVSLVNDYQGAFPIDNEWDQYIVQSTLGGKITAGDNAVWNYGSSDLKNRDSCWTSGTPHLSLGASSTRVVRGHGGIHFSGESTAQVTFSRFSTASAFTLEAVIETTNTSSAKTYTVCPALSILGDGSNGVFFGFGVTGGKLEYGTWSTGSMTTYAGNINVADGKPHHVAVTHTTGTVKLYVDGVLDATYSVSGTPACNPDRIGAGYGGHYFAGSIAEVRVWNKVLSDLEIYQVAFAELNGNETSLLHYWKLREISGTTATDSVTTGAINGLLGSESLTRPNKRGFAWQTTTNTTARVNGFRPVLQYEE